MFLHEVRFSIYHFWRTAPGHGHIVLNNNFIGKFSLTPEELSLYREEDCPEEVRSRLYKKVSQWPLIKVRRRWMNSILKLLPASPVHLGHKVWHLTDSEKFGFVKKEHLEPLTERAVEMLSMAPVDLAIQVGRGTRV